MVQPFPAPPPPPPPPQPRFARPRVLVPIGIVIVLVAVAALVAVALSHRPRSVMIETQQGSLRGLAQDGARSFRDIPYAAPPVGPLRWRRPQPAPSWTGVRNGEKDGDACLQAAPYTYGGSDLTPKSNSSEDCLYLNVNRPDDTRQGLPVIVWLPGGGFLEGSGGGPIYNSPTLVQRGVVVVTVNYRLGLFGFFAHPGLDESVANFGLLDQEAALRWVQANIATFGGDPDNVTLAGESAGAMSVNALMSMPSARGLFAKAISESAPGDIQDKTLAQASASGEQAYPGLSADQLRALPATDLLSSTFNTLFGDAPIIDSVLPKSAAATFAAGEEARVPYLEGSNEFEFADQTFALFDTNASEVRASLGGAQHDALVTAYGGQQIYDVIVLNDLVFNAPALSLAFEHQQRAPTYRYRFAALGNATGHSAEIPYVFDTVTDRNQRPVADQVSDYWAAFARTGRPEVASSPEWPEAKGSAYLQFTPTGAETMSSDPWAARLTTLAQTLPLELPQ